MRHDILKKYDDMKKAVKDGHYNDNLTNIIDELYSLSNQYLNNFNRTDLISKVLEKEYFAFDNSRKISRAINKNLYLDDINKWGLLKDAMDNDDISNLSSEEITQILYSMAISFCASVDMLKDGDQKTPGTFYEYFIAYFFTWIVGVEPAKFIQILNIDEENTNLPTDFVFNLGSKKQKFHMPIKTSTRERSIMLWAHQKLIDGVYGIERFMGTPVLLAETKTAKAKREVVEICLSEQWKVYQTYIAKLKRIYYLDVPAHYIRLNYEFPPIHVKPFGDFFFEWSELMPS